MSLGKITYETIPDAVKNIANDTLGRSVLRNIFNYRYTYFLMMKVSNGDVIGFSLYHFENYRAGQTQKIVGIIDCVCVAPKFRKEGFGTLLTFGTLRKMGAYSVSRIEIVLRSPRKEGEEPGKNIIGSEKLLGALGFARGVVLEEFYSKLKSGDTAVCDTCETGCKCDGVLFSIEE